MKEESLAELWSWLVDMVTEDQRSRGLPQVLHSESGDRDDWGDSQDEAIRGMPFTRSFASYLDGRHTPLNNAVAVLRPSRKNDPQDSSQGRQARRRMWRIVSAVVTDGETDTEAVRARLGMSEFTFSVAALNGILALRSYLNQAE